MPKEIYKILGQALPALSTETDLYDCAKKRSAIVQIFAFNNDASAAIVTIAIVPNGAGAAAPATVNANKIVWDESIPAKSPLDKSILKGITLGEFDEIRVESDNAVTTFHVYGVEIEP